MNEQPSPAWTVVFVTGNRSLAERLREHLAAEGLLVRLREPAAGEVGARRTFELLVPEGEAEEASELLSRSIPR